MRHLPLLAGVLFATAAAPPRALADTSPQAQTTAEALYQESAELAKQQRWAEAAQKLVASNQIDPAVGTYIRLGDCYEHLHRSASAWTAYTEALALARKRNDKRTTIAEQDVQRVEPTLARVTLAVAPQNHKAGVTISRDGLDLPEAAWDSPVPVDPGEHTIEASAPGKKPWTTTVKIEAKPGIITVQVPALENAPNQPQPQKAATSPAPGSWWIPRRIAGASVGGAGVVGLAIGTAFGIVTFNKTNDAKNHCSPTMPLCDATGVSLESSAKTSAHVSDAALAIGAAALVTGITLILLPQAPATTSPASLRLAPVLARGQAGLAAEGRW